MKTSRTITNSAAIPSSACNHGPRHLSTWIVSFAVALFWQLPAVTPQANGVTIQSFPVGFDPTGLAYDGVNVWVVNQSSNNVTKLRASDGANLGTFAVGNVPLFAAFDGANIWVTNWASDTVTKLRAS